MNMHYVQWFMRKWLVNFESISFCVSKYIVTCSYPCSQTNTSLPQQYFKILEWKCHGTSLISWWMCVIYRIQKRYLPICFFHFVWARVQLLRNAHNSLFDWNSPSRMRISYLETLKIDKNYMKHAQYTSSSKTRCLIIQCLSID